MAFTRVAVRWLWLARWLRAEASFHFIHAADIATVCAHLATSPHAPNPEPGQGALRRLVLGQAPLTVNEAVATLCRWRGLWRPPVGLDLQGWLIEGLIRLLRLEVNAWDRFSIRQAHGERRRGRGHFQHKFGAGSAPGKHVDNRHNIKAFHRRTP